MDSTQVFTAGQQALYMMLLVAAPILLGVLAVGLIVSILQAATQINEASLSFVPKLLAVILALALFGSWMISMMVHFFTDVYNHMPPVVH